MQNYYLMVGHFLWRGELKKGEGKSGITPNKREGAEKKSTLRGRGEGGHTNF